MTSLSIPRVVARMETAFVDADGNARECKDRQTFVDVDWYGLVLLRYLGVGKLLLYESRGGAPTRHFSHLRWGHVGHAV